MRRKLVLLFVLVVLLPSSASLHFTVDGARRAMLRGLRRRAADHLNVALRAFETSHRDLGWKARIIAQSEDLRDATGGGDRLQLVDRCRALHRDLGLHLLGAILEVYDARGQLLVQVPRTRAPRPSSTLIDSALEGRVQSRLRCDAEGLLLTASQPVYHASRPQPAGAVLLRLRVDDRLADEIAGLSASQVLLWRGASPAPVNCFASTLRSEGRRLRPKTVQAPPGEETLRAGHGEWLAASKRFQAEGGAWGLTVLLDATEGREALASLRRSLMSIALLALVLALLVAVLFAQRSVIRPIAQLVAEARRLGSGQLDGAVRVEGRDEFALLAETFDGMRLDLGKAMSGLERKVHELSMLDAINQTIIARGGSSLFREILATVCRSLGAERSSILLADEQRGRLVLRQVHCRDGESTVKVREYLDFGEGEGIAGLAAQSDEAVVCNDVQQDERYKRYAVEALDADMRNLLCVRLQGDDGLLGVINVANKDGDFSSEDASLLRNVARQVAIAIQKARLYEAAITDGMTGLFIHSYFKARLATEVERARRYGKRLSLVMFDIDLFKGFNDRWGHQLGDRVIRMVAEVLKGNHRENVDICARYGGEEFAVLCPELDGDGCMAFAERLRRCIETSNLQAQDEPLQVTVSLGVAEYPGDADEAELLLARADAALYRSKERGRNRCSRWKAED